MPIFELSIEKALSFRSAMRKMETPVMGIKQLLGHSCFRGVVIEMERH
jgi:hypothetical protein